jgi:tRNA-dihydrouridine synthase
MKLYFAPMEGVTNYLFRREFDLLFGGADKYYTPFISPCSTKKFQSKEGAEIDPAHNAGRQVVPQLLTNEAEHFLWAAQRLRELGYEEVNLNLGCPSGTVAAKKKGSGFLFYPDELDAFLDQLFSAAGEMKISVKTRIGRKSAEEWPHLLEIFNRYPISELTVHPRIQTQQYNGVPDWDAFDYTVAHTTIPLCYNGDLCTVDDVQRFEDRFPQTQAIMLGRGAVRNPALLRMLRGGDELKKEELQTFHDRLYGAYRERLSGDKNPIFRMRELWHYWGDDFTDAAPYLKHIRKAEHRSEYESAVTALFREQELNI